MPDIWNLTADNLEIFLLVLFRVGGFFVVAPFWSYTRIPRRVKAAISLVLALVLTPLVAPSSFTTLTTLTELAALGVREVMTGGIIGFVYSILFAGIQAAGQAAGLQMGFSIVNVIDPNTQDNVSLLGEFKFLILMLIFMLIDGHHLVLQSLVESFRVVPLGALSTSSLVPEHLMRLSGLTFVIAVKIAAPVIVTLLLTDVALGVVARTVPQMNIFIVGFPLKIGVGLLVLAASIPLLSVVFTKLLYQLQAETTAIIGAMTGRP